MSQPPQRRTDKPVEDYPELDRVIQPFGFLGMHVSWVTSYGGEIYLYPYLPRIAPGFGVGLRFRPDRKFSDQAEVALDFLGGSYIYPPFAYVYAVTYLSVPLLARHRISQTDRSTKHFTWGLQFNQKLGEGYNGTFFGIPVYVSSYGSYSGGFNTRTISAAIGYQSRKRKHPSMWSSEFEMRLNVGLTSFGEGNNGVSGFNFRWNLVPPTQ